MKFDMKLVLCGRFGYLIKLNFVRDKCAYHTRTDICCEQHISHLNWLRKDKPAVSCRLYLILYRDAYFGYIVCCVTVPTSLWLYNWLLGLHSRMKRQSFMSYSCVMWHICHFSFFHFKMSAHALYPVQLKSSARCILKMHKHDSQNQKAPLKYCT